MFPISRSLSTSRRRTHELGSRLERPIHFECKLNKPMHIFSGWPALVLRAPPRCLSSRKCMMSSLEHGWHLSLPETAPVAHPPSPLTAERRGGIRRSRRWSDRLRCNCVQGPLLPGAVIRCSPPGPVGTRRP